MLLANVMAPYVAWGVGDDSEISVPFSMLATLLAAFIERPFTTYAGFDRLALLYSIRANILSWFLGLIVAYASLTVGNGSLFFVVVFIAIPLSIGIEGGYLYRIKRLNDSRFHWTPIVIGNIVSGLVLLLIKIFGFEWGFRLQMEGASTVVFLRDFRPSLTFTVFYSCIAIFLLTLFVPPSFWNRSSIVTQQASYGRLDTATTELDNSNMQ